MDTTPSPPIMRRRRHTVNSDCDVRAPTSVVRHVTVLHDDEFNAWKFEDRKDALLTGGEVEPRWKRREQSIVANCVSVGIRHASASVVAVHLIREFVECEVESAENDFVCAARFAVSDVRVVDVAMQPRVSGPVIVAVLASQPTFVLQAFTLLSQCFEFVASGVNVVRDVDE